MVGIGAWAAYNWLASLNSGNTNVSQNDTVAPKISLNIPNSSLEFTPTQKVLRVSANVSDNHMIDRVEYLLDDKVVARSVEDPFEVTISLVGLKEGKHTLQAIAYDGAGNSAKSKIFTFTIKPGENEVVPEDETSEEIVQGSTSIRSNSVKAKTAGTGSNSGSNNSGDTGGNNGGNPGPNPGNPDDNLRTTGGWYSQLPTSMQVCSNGVLSGGPATAPAGTNVITVPAGDNKTFNFTQDNKVFWFAPGEHTLGTDPDTEAFSAITPGNGSTYIGAPGAIIDGRHASRYAFKGHASNVRIAYLEIRNFGRIDVDDNNNEGVINHDSGTGWVMEYLNAHNNDGAAVFVGSDNIVRYSCLKDNGQYGFSMYKPQIEGDWAIKNIELDHNEIVGNNQDDWESQIEGCGCTGGGKFWDVLGAKVTNNYVHDNLSTGLWADTNDTDFLFDSNWVEHNQGEGIWYEISYNATMSRNVLKRNAWTSGNNNTGSPGPAIYISESGGDSRLPSTVSGSTQLRIMNNLVENNFSGITIYENSNRFCNSNGNTSKSYCTPFVTPTIIEGEDPPSSYPNPIDDTHPCYTNVGSAPYTENCRWHSKNVQVFYNQFTFDDTVVPCAGTFCGVHALFATGVNNISWAPAAYNIANVQNDVMFNNNNKFAKNSYNGRWRFAKGYGEKISFNSWQAAPFVQDTDSTYVAPPVANAIDANTATLEGGIGAWQSWYGGTPTRTTEDAHTGTHSLKMTLDGGSWGTNLSNYPGFEATPGNKRISFWAKQGSGTASAATLRVKWYNLNGEIIKDTSNNDIITSVPISGLSSGWQQASLDFTAPTGTATLVLELVGSSGSAGSVLYFDDFTVADN